MKTYSKISIVISALLMIVLGIIMLLNPAETLVSLSLLIGIFMAASGISALVFYFSAARGFVGSGAVLFTGISNIVIGILFMNQGVFVAQIFTFILGLLLTVFGVERFVRSFDLKNAGFSNWWLTLLLGIVCAALGILSMAAPITGAILVSAILGTGFILYGAALLALLHSISNM